MLLCVQLTERIRLFNITASITINKKIIFNLKICEIVIYVYCSAFVILHLFLSLTIRRIDKIAILFGHFQNFVFLLCGWHITISGRKHKTFRKLPFSGNSFTTWLDELWKTFQIYIKPARAFSAYSISIAVYWYTFKSRDN